MTVQSGLCQTWPKAQIVGFLMYRRIYLNNSDVSEKFTLSLGHNVQPRRLPLDEKDVYYSLLSILQYLTKGSVLLLLALGYAQLVKDLIP